jgi:hypothetical protein
MDRLPRSLGIYSRAVNQEDPAVSVRVINLLFDPEREFDLMQSHKTYADICTRYSLVQPQSIFLRLQLCVSVIIIRNASYNYLQRDFLLMFKSNILYTRYKDNSSL